MKECFKCGEVKLKRMSMPIDLTILTTTVNTTGSAEADNLKKILGLIVNVTQLNGLHT
jgi:chaperone required for assembly of F1-ATPase